MTNFFIKSNSIINNITSIGKLVNNGFIYANAFIDLSFAAEAYNSGDIDGGNMGLLNTGAGIWTGYIGGIPSILIYGTYSLIMQTPNGDPMNYHAPFGVRDATSGP